jgi:Porin PorA
MTRHVTGLIAAALAAFAAASGVFLGWYAAGQAAEVPLGEQVTATLTAAHASYFSPTRLTEITGANLEVTEAITENTSPSYPGIAIWDVFGSVYDTTNHQRLESMSRTLVFDRKTAELVNCCGESVSGNSSIYQTGIVGYVFPLNAQKKTYEVFDTTLNKPEPFVYSGTGSVNGIQAYKFIENIPSAQAGFSQFSSTEPQYYSMHLVYWVDPMTGELLAVNEHEDLYLVNPATNARVTTLFNADLSATPATVKNMVAIDNSSRNRITLLEIVLPLVCGIAGALATAAGFLLSRTPRKAVRSGLAIATYPSPDAAAAGQAGVAPKHDVQLTDAEEPNHAQDPAVTAPLNGHLIPGMDLEQEPARRSRPARQPSSLHSPSTPRTPPPRRR